MWPFTSKSDKQIEALKIISRLKTEGEIIQEIHNAFDSAQDRLLKEAEEVLKKAQEEEQEKAMTLGMRYDKIGFKNTPDALVAKEIKKSLSESRETASMIVYYKNNYPFLKFLTIQELDSICEKYGLIHMEVDKYIKQVPEKNLLDIEKAQGLKYKDRDDVNRESRIGYSLRFGLYEYDRERKRLDDIVEVKLQIAAPPSHFDLKDMVKSNDNKYKYVREVKDPIVFRYVKGGIQVITKWGLEASDDSLIVDKMN